MPKKLTALLLLLPVVLSGCIASRQIESAAVIETVSVSRQGGSQLYTFFRLTDSDSPDAVSVSAESFEQALQLAAAQYIPNLSLAKLELLLYQTDVERKALRADIDYISTQASFSPVACLALCDENVLRRLRQKTETQSLIKQQLILCKNQNPTVQLDYLSVFNSFARQSPNSFSVAFITSDGEMKISAGKME